MGAAIVVALAVAFLTQSAVGGLLVGLVFGGARAVPALLLGRAASHGELRSMAAGLERRAPVAERATIAALVAAGAVLLIGAAS